jgi:ubiquinone/menaquinone biosynthesis C-methylase UbiE
MLGVPFARRGPGGLMGGDVPDRLRTHVSPRTAVVWSLLRDELDQRVGSSRSTAASVLDLGGGSGVFAVPLAELGHRVTVVDTSPDALATLQRRAAEAGVGDRVTAVSGDVDGLPAGIAGESYDLVLCHGLLEVVDDPATTLATMAGAVAAGGCASVLVAGRPGFVLSRALGGRPAEALRALAAGDSPAGVADGVLRRFDTAEVCTLVGTAGLTVESVHGVGVVSDLVPGALIDGAPGVAEALRELELAAAVLPPYRDIATQLHVLARRS